MTIDTEVPYGTGEWAESVEQAVISNFNRTLSYLSDWPLSVWLIDEARQYILEKHMGTDVGELLEATALVIEEENGMDTPYSPDLFMRVLQSYNGNTTSDFGVLIEEHAREQGTPEHLMSTFMDGIRCDEEDWYFRKVVPDGHVYAETAAGGTAYWFKRNEW